MHDMLQMLSIAATSEKVYEALTSEQGLQQWWTEDATTVAKIDSIAEFGFFDRAVVLKMHITTLSPSTHVGWTCVDGPSEWKDTTLAFSLMPTADSGTNILFQQSGGEDTKERKDRLNKYWSAALRRLKSYAEGKPRGPLHPRGA